MKHLIMILLGVCLLSAATIQSVHADRFSDWLTIWKKEQEQKAKEYQKSVLHFDYDKIKKHDKGFKFPIPSDSKKKHIANDKPITLKVIKAKQ